MEVMNVVSEMLRNGANRINDLRVSNVTVTPMESYVRLSIKVDKPVPGYVADTTTGEMVKGEKDLIFVSTFAICSVLRNDDNTATIVDHLISNPNGLKLILQGAKIDIIQQEIKKDDEYHNPFSSSNDTTKMTHDCIITDVINVKLSASADKWIDKIKDAMLGI